MNTKYHEGVDLLGVKEMIAGVGEIGVDSDSVFPEDIKPAF